MDTIIKTLAYIFEYTDKLQNQVNRFSRIHFHSLKFHIVAQSKKMWEPGRISVAAGSFKASIQSCEWDQKIHSPDNLYTLLVDESTLQFKDKDPVLYHQYKNIEYYIAPVLVCKSPSKTVGLGDAISSAGLIYHNRKI